MLRQALFDPFSLVVLAALLVMIGIAASWQRAAQRQFDVLRGGLKLLRRIGGELHGEHPIRKRLESAPVVELSFEEIARLMIGEKWEPAARGLVALEAKISWTERFAQFAIHLGILGTVFAMVTSDPTDLEGFRARLPAALGTTFWGLIGAITLSMLAGACESLFDRARVHVREALLEGLEKAKPERDASSPGA
jgi:hypothetical protein